MTTVFQLIAVASLLAFTVLAVRECAEVGKAEKEKTAPSAWRIHSVLQQGNGQKRTLLGGLMRRRENLQDYVEKPLGLYILGNRRRDDIYVDCPGRRVKIFLNFLENEVEVTALKGEIYIDHATHPADSRTVMKVKNGGFITIRNIRLGFEKVNAAL